MRGSSFKEIIVTEHSRSIGLSANVFECKQEDLVLWIGLECLELDSPKLLSRELDPISPQFGS